MYVEIEPTGCRERKGLVQVRLCMYLEPGDYGYEVHHVQTPEGWRDNPFHNHFIYVKPETSDEEIMDIAEAFLEEAYIKWSRGEILNLENPPVQFDMSAGEARKRAVERRVSYLQNTYLRRKL